MPGMLVGHAGDVENDAGDVDGLVLHFASHDFFERPISREVLQNTTF